MPDDPAVLAAARDALVERLAEGYWRLGCPNQDYPWTEENRPTADAYRRAARYCLDAITLAGLRLVPADTDPTDAEQAVLWMHEAQHQAAERDRNYAEVQRLTGELATVTGQRDDALQMLGDLHHPAYQLTNDAIEAIEEGPQ